MKRTLGQLKMQEIMIEKRDAEDPFWIRQREIRGKSRKDKLRVTYLKNKTIIQYGTQQKIIPPYYFVQSDCECTIGYNYENYEWYLAIQCINTLENEHFEKLIFWIFINENNIVMPFTLDITTDNIYTVRSILIDSGSCIKIGGLHY